MTHTKGPWKYDEVWALIKGANGEEVAAIHSGQGDNARVDRNIAWANARLIVAAVNSYDAMREALQDGVQRGIFDKRWLVKAEAALALADGRVVTP